MMVSSLREAKAADFLLDLARSHDCFSHPLFDSLRSGRLEHERAVRLLRDYDVHASLLRRLLLQAAASMPEPAVGFVLENVRNEYGNGCYSRCHQGQLHDLIDRVAATAGIVTRPHRPTSGVRQYLKQVVRLYQPGRGDYPAGMFRPAIVAGAITATEIMAVEEFRCLQIAFRQLGLGEHRWFDHVTVECEHSDDSLALAGFFLTACRAREAVEYGFHATLEANQSLYDGLLECIRGERAHLALQEPGRP